MTSLHLHVFGWVIFFLQYFTDFVKDSFFLSSDWQNTFADLFMIKGIALIINRITKSFIIVVKNQYDGIDFLPSC